MIHLTLASFGLQAAGSYCKIVLRVMSFLFLKGAGQNMTTSTGSSSDWHKSHQGAKVSVVQERC